MLLESMEAPACCFITLTYGPDYLPYGGIVRKRDVQLFLKNLRISTYPRKVRYYICSEYGERDSRPHYHGILYGLSPVDSVVIEKAWGRGHVMVGTAEPKSMSYVSGYVIKQCTQEGNLLRGTRTLEFSLMSKNPGLGHGVVERIKRAYETEQGRAALAKEPWISGRIRVDGRIYPLGKYLQNLCLEIAGIDAGQKSDHLLSVITTKIEENRGKTRSEIQVERKARSDQEQFRAKQKPRRF